MKKIKVITSIFLVVLIVVSSFTSISASAENTPVETQPDILLIEDNKPWRSDANHTVLSKLNYNYKTITTSELSTEVLWNYKMIIIANDQTLSTYQKFKEFKSNLDLFANLGGTIIYGASDAGWADGEIDFDLPGGLKKTKEYAENNYIVDTDHSIVTGALTDGTALTDNDMVSNYCSHGYFIEDTLPKDSNIIFKSSYSDAPTAVEYPYGSGHVIATTLTWEHNYVHKETFATIAMDDLFAYGYALSKEEVSGKKMKIGADNNAFTHSSSSFFAKNEAHQYQIDSDLFERLVSYYNEDILQWESLPTTRQNIQKERVSKWGGSCYGISVSMALAHVNEIDLKNFDKSANDYYAVKTLVNNPRFRSLINYYQLSQYLPVVEKKSVDVYANDRKDFADGLQKIVNMALQSEKSGHPFIFTFGYKWYTTNALGIKKWDSAGHAIVCVGAEKAKKGYRLEFVDPNNNDDYIYANVSSDYKSISFETTYNAKYQKDNRNRQSWQITRVGYDTLTLFKSIDIDGADNKTVGITKPNKKVSPAPVGAYGNGENYDVILFKSNTAFTLTADDGKTISFDGAEITGDMNIIDISYYEGGNTVGYQLVVDSHNSYTIDQERDTIDITIYNSNQNFYGFIGDGSEKINFDMKQGVAVEGEKMSCSVFCGISNEKVDLVQVSNKKTDSLAVTQQSNELIVEGDNLKEANFTGFFENDITEFEPVESEADDKIVINNEDIHVHAYSITRTEPTCTENGKMEYVCECGHSYSETIDKIPHSYETKINKATLSKNGSVVKTCTVCNKTSKTTTKYPKTFKLSTTSYSYNGKVKTPSVVVKDSAGKTLKKDTDYTVTYAKGRKDIGTYKVTVKMKGKYSGTKTLTFKINPANISKCKVKLSATSYTYDGKVKTPSVVVKSPAGKTLKKGTNYTVTYSKGRKAIGTYKVTVKMKGKYTGSKTLTFKIKPISISKCKVKLSATSYTYNGKVKTPSVIVKSPTGKTLKKGTHYSVTYSKGRKNIGTYKVAVKMKGKYSGSKTLTFKINSLGSKCKVKLSNSSYTYNGRVKTPAVIVKNPSGKTLKKGTHYTVTYSKGRKNVGTYKVIVKLKGKYSITKTLSFKINPTKTAVSKLATGKKSIKVAIAKKSKQITGYQIQYSTSKKFSKATTKTISNYKTTKYTLKGLSAKKTYFVRARTYKKVGSKIYYSGWSTYKYAKTK